MYEQQRKEGRDAEDSGKACSLMLHRPAVVQLHAEASEGYPGQNVSKMSLSNARWWV